MAAAAIHIQNVVKRYEQHTAIRGLSLTVPEATVYGLLGPNGAGKTTTIRMALNIIAPDSGSIMILGRPYDDPALVDRIGYLPEERGLYRKMQVRRVLRFLARLKGMSGSGIDRRIDMWLERLGLRQAGGEDWGNARIDQLSRGMQQKVQFIGSLIHDPELVILDEPFSGLDPINAQALKDTVVDLRKNGTTVIFSTHVMDNAERMCDSVCIIAHGTKVLDGTMAEVRASHGARIVALTLTGDVTPAIDATLHDGRLVSAVDDSNRSLELELAPGADSNELLRRLVLAGAVVERFEVVRPSLHRIFLERVGATNVERGLSGHG